MDSYYPENAKFSNAQLGELRALGGDQRKLSVEERYRMASDTAQNLPGWIPSGVRAGLTATALTAAQLPYDVLKGIYAISGNGIVSKGIEKFTNFVQPGAGFNRFNTSAPSLEQYKATLAGSLQALSRNSPQSGPY